MDNKINSEIPLEELWKHVQYVTAMGEIDPRAYPEDTGYIRDRCRVIVAHAVEQALSEATDRLARDVIEDIIKSGPGISGVATLHVSAGFPEALGVWLSSMLCTGVIKQPADTED